MALYSLFNRNRRPNYQDRESPTTGLTMRPRRVSPPEIVGEAGRERPQVSPGQLPSKMPRWKAGLFGALAGMGNAANLAMQSGNVGWGGVAQALGGAAGGGALGAAQPQIILRQRQQQREAEEQARQGEQLQTEEQQARLENIRAQTAQRQAEARRSPEQEVVSGLIIDKHEDFCDGVKHMRVGIKLDPRLPGPGEGVFICSTRRSIHGENVVLMTNGRWSN